MDPGRRLAESQWILCSSAAIFLLVLVEAGILATLRRGG